MNRAIIAVAAGLACIIASPSFAKSDSAFLTDVVTGNNAEIAIGTLAETQGATAAAKAFGKVLVTDHTKSNHDVAALAKKAGVTDLTAIAPADQTEIAKLKGLSGKAFDTEFAGAMAAAHRMMIVEFTDQTKLGSKATAALAKKTLPTLTKHLKLAEALAVTG